VAFHNAESHRFSFAVQQGGNDFCGFFEIVGYF